MNIKNKNDIIKFLSENKNSLEKRFGVSKIGLFGSYVKNMNSENSDIDILVYFKSPVGFIEFMKLENYLSEQLNKKIDLVTEEALKPNIGKEILKEVEYV